MSRNISLFFALFMAASVPSDAFGGPLHEATKTNDVAAIEQLVRDGAELDETDFVLGTPLHLAIAQGNREIVVLLLGHGADVEAVSEQQGARPVHLAASLNEDQILQLLIENGADIDSRDSEGRTALHHAALFGEVEAAKVLVDNGAGLDLQDNRHGSIALSQAAFRGNLEIARLLVQHGADVNKKNNSGRTPLMYAATPPSVRAVGGSELIDLLVESGADLDATQDNGMTALAWAYDRKLENVMYEKVIEILIGHGAKD